MWQVPEVIRVDSLANFQWVHAEDDEIEIEPLLPDQGPLTPQLLADAQGDRAHARGLARLPGQQRRQDRAGLRAHQAGIRPAGRPAAITAETRKLVAECRRGDHVFHLTGGPIITYAFRSVQQDIVGPRAGAAADGAAAPGRDVPARRRRGACRCRDHRHRGRVARARRLARARDVGGHVDAAAGADRGVRRRRRALAGGASIGRAAPACARKEAAHYSLQKNFLPTFLTSITTAARLLSFVTANLRPIWTSACWRARAPCWRGS